MHRKGETKNISLKYLRAERPQIAFVTSVLIFAASGNTQISGYLRVQTKQRRYFIKTRPRQPIVGTPYCNLGRWSYVFRGNSMNVVYGGSRRNNLTAYMTFPPQLPKIRTNTIFTRVCRAILQRHITIVQDVVIVCVCALYSKYYFMKTFRSI